MATAVAPQAPTFERIATPAAVLVTMATLSAAAAVVHLVMVPSHMDEFAAEGIAFAVAGWLQLLVAFSLWTQPSRALLGFPALPTLPSLGLSAASSQDWDGDTIGFVTTVLAGVPDFEAG